MKFKISIILVIGIIAIFLVSFGGVYSANDTNGSDNGNGTSEDLDPIVIPPEKNPDPTPSPSPSPNPSHSKNVKKVPMKTTGVPIAFAMLSLIVSVSLFVRRD